MNIKQFVKTLDLQPQDIYRDDCPICGNTNTLSVRNTGTAILYNCFHADCNVKGSLTTEPTKQAFTIRKVFNTNSKFSIPNYFVSPLRNENAVKYLNKGFGGLVGFELKGGAKAGKKFIDNLKLFYHVANIGDSRSLAIHPATTTHSQLTEEELLAAGVTPGYVRLSIGIEHPDDIIADLKQALDASGKPSLKAVS